MYFNIAVFAIILTSIYLLIRNRYTYWKRRGVPYLQPSYIYGNLKEVGSKIHYGQFVKKIYDVQKNKTPIYGLYSLLSPIALVLDLDLIKNIMVKDFNYFSDRGMFVNETDDPLSAHLFSLEGTKWKILRAKLSPTFTSGKMKFMFPTIAEVGERFERTVLGMVNNKVDLEIKDLMARFTTDVIGTCAFGIECNCLKDPNVEFRVQSSKPFDAPRHNEITRQWMQSNRKLAEFLKMKSERDDVSEFFLRVVRETVDYREKNNIRRNDFMDLLLQIKNNGNIDGEKDLGLGTISIEEIAAQCYIFFLAGFETSSSTMSFCLYELSLFPEIQDKVRHEILSVLTKYNDQLTYDAVQEMTYLKQVVNETLRKYPLLPTLARRTIKDYQIPNTKWTIEKGTKVHIPVYGIHYDPDIYPQPEKFNPERFSPEQVKQRHPMTHLPFGDGPRNCVGLRFGKLQVLIGLIILLRSFKFNKCDLTEVPLKISSTSLLLASVGGIWLNVEKI